MKKKYVLDRDKRAYVVDTINDQEVCVAVNISAIKVVHKNHPNQCTSRVIACMKQCTQGVQMNWSLFLFNQLMEYAMLVQEGK